MRKLLAIALLLAGIAVAGLYMRKHLKGSPAQGTAVPVSSTQPAANTGGAKPGPFLRGQPSSDNKASAGAAPIHSDVRKGATLRLRVAPNLPEITLKFIADGNPDADSAVINRIEVYRGQETSPMQDLTECEMEETPYRGAIWATTDDINFDGYRDLQMLRLWGVTGQENFCVWTFSASTGRFEYNPAFDFNGEGGYELDPAQKIIRVREQRGLAGRQYALSSYRVVNNKPVLVALEEQMCDETKPVLKRTWYQPDPGGTLAEVRSEKDASPEPLCGGRADSTNDNPGGSQTAEPNNIEIIRRAQTASAAQLEPGLPDEPFSNWLKKTLGPNAAIAWTTNDCGEQDGSGRQTSTPVCADAEATFPDGRKLSVWIAVGSQSLRSPKAMPEFSPNPGVWWITLSAGGERECSLRHLADIPALIKLSPEQLTKACK